VSIKEAGVYLSDKGHLLILKSDPTSVTCAFCAVTCARSGHKSKADFAGAAANFVEKHGALDFRIANTVEEIVKHYLKSYVPDYTKESFPSDDKK